MPFFTSGALARLRTIAETDLPHRATLLELVDGQGAGGRPTVTPTQIEADVPCRLSAVNLPTTTTTTQGQLVPSGATWRVVFSVRQMLTDVERVVVTGMDDNGLAFTRTLRVIRPDTPVTDGMLRVLYGADV